MSDQNAAIAAVSGHPWLTDAIIGAVIRARREERDASLHAIAQSAGINIKVLSRIERGERSCRVSEMVSIAKALRTSPQKMLQRTKDHAAALVSAENTP